MTEVSTNHRLIVSNTLIQTLVASQFPRWARLPIRPVAAGGWDNNTFRLGEDMIVRLPSAAEYAQQVTKEHRWLPVLAPLLPLPIPTPLAMGSPSNEYPFDWSIYRWLDGDTALPERIVDLREFAIDLAQFLLALQRIDPTCGPTAGAHNFHRGGDLVVYDAETRRAIEALEGQIDQHAATAVWEDALAARWCGAPVWIHGDVSVGNLLVRAGELSGVIDFGQLGVGDPACDLSIAWTLFEGESRADFRALLPFDTGTWARARGWTLWKALIVAAGLADSNGVEAARPLRLVAGVLADSARRS